MKLPDRWLPYKPMGERIEGTRFISFKVPLRQAFNDNLSEKERFSPEMLMERCPAMQLIIDLTNTTKYYNSNTFTEAGVAYKKIKTPGHVIPARQYILEFFKIVDDFLASSADDDSLIGVHCTHGLNRTSYFICCYMIHRMGFDPQNAVEAFEKARGHKIERQNYVNDLMIRGKGSASERQSSVRERHSGPLHPAHRSPKWQGSRTYSDSRSNGRAQWDSRMNGPGDRDSRPHSYGHRDSRPNGPGNWKPRLNGNPQASSMPNGQAPRDSRVRGRTRWDQDERRVASDSNWRNKPDDSSSQHSNQRYQQFEKPPYGHPSSSRQNPTSFEERNQQQPRGNVPCSESTQQYPTYKTWRAAREAGNQGPPPDQRPGQRPSLHQRPGQPPHQRPALYQSTGQRPALYQPLDQRPDKHPTLNQPPHQRLTGYQPPFQSLPPHQQ